MHQTICVFCGASDGVSPAYAHYARALGHLLALQKRRLVYGGGKKGLMGVLADAVLEAGGQVTGIIPQRLVEAETAHRGLTQLEVVPDMHARKARMAALADGFIALPGGIGTLEELFEIWTWGQIGYHAKPVGLLDVNGFYRPLNQLLLHMAQQGFVRHDYLQTLHLSESPEVLLRHLDAYQPKNHDRWAT
ncbi:TIGR00730 family Rossman fold protein [Chimaeribacter arupi]|uniref:Cytokinin riboside 5'-monophosphate phosphoribohydrolase n=2 Tax=Yersiniaceae TaxID=1903411 RepID=A0A2N5ER60_9GAMM|nr:MULTISPECIES: TIGR00730 family Rossman fold protein [Yersiniaceae]MBS0970897.1 TIGR00730 family Rossman fold protein [Nissabacter archeti]MDV5139166.1 TIGR00730 family Rossman fold protein [Chimaeribacter arupi]PLR36637.1 TIGR00730 family Rossman fold protein [Chimaeribacter arupi]PLR48579.1 TIGR00730 family Rossman fold protein [Chimaeribacter arupi]PLR51717.1 TIGR00730 family Rossman fold protein [Chimaeribacter arupi]